MGVLFFASLTVAGLTSLLSIVEVVVSAVRDKLGIPKVQATLVIGIPMTILSIFLLSTTTGLYFLDITDEFVNKYGILGGAWRASSRRCGSSANSRCCATTSTVSPVSRWAGAGWRWSVLPRRWCLATC